jgi:hypothetical protein
MSDETPAAAAAPAPVVAPASPAPFFGIGVQHLLGAGAALGGGGALTYLTGEIQPVIHWLVTGGAPDAPAEHSLATLAALAVIAAAGLIANYTRARPVPAASKTGDTPNAS